jgi:multicomponent Na+:H+ antiporter subunit D
MPITGATSLIGSMSIAGVPPFNGFFSKLMIILACVAAGRYGYAAWAVLASVTTLVAFMKVQKYAFFGSLRERWRSLRAVPLPMQAAMVLLASLCLAMSALVVPSARRRFLEPARRSLVDRQGYVEKVLGKRALADQEKPIEVVKR